jgi:hypothetical protein
MNLDVTLLNTALALVNKMAPSLNIGLRASKGRLAVSGEANGTAITAFIPYEGKDKFEVMLSKEVLDKSVKSRKQLDVEVKESTLFLRSGKTFKAELSTQPHTGTPELDKAAALEITADQQEILAGAIPSVMLRPVYERDVMFFVEFNKKGTAIACMDKLHFALYQAPGTKQSLSMVFPSKTFATITSAANKAEYNLAATASSICAWNDNFELLLPFVQTEVEQGIEAAIGAAAEFGKGCAIVNTHDLIKALESASATCEHGGSLSLRTGNNMIEISSNSTLGKVVESVEATTKKAKFSIDPNTVLDLLTCVPTEEVEIGIHNSFFFARAQDDDIKYTYGCLLSQDGDADDSNDED